MDVKTHPMTTAQFAGNPLVSVTVNKLEINTSAENVQIKHKKLSVEKVGKKPFETRDKPHFQRYSLPGPDF
jgi:hypothetical protein